MRDYSFEERAFAVMKEVAVQAGAIIMNVYDTDFAVDYKADASPVTEADKQANACIVAALQPFLGQEVALLSEEMKDDLSRREKPYCFIVDPLDGTKEFVNRNGQFTVNIALVYEQQPVLGVIYVPVTKTLYYGSKEGAVRLEYIEDSQQEKASQEMITAGDFEEFDSVGKRLYRRFAIHVSDKTKDLIWVGSKSHSGEKEQAMIAAHEDLIATTISAGSSLKGCLVAEQKADVYYRFGYTCEWDTAAMHAIALGAGALVMQTDHTPLVYNRENTLNDKGFYIVNRKENVWSL